MSEKLKEQIVEAIKKVFDPEIPVNIYELGLIYDIDIKKDFRLEQDEYKEVIKACSIMTKESSNRDKGFRVFKANDNYGIEWSIRTTSKYLTNPFLKIYSKDFELMTPTDKGGANDFYNEYLKAFNISNLKRIETTVKNLSLIHIYEPTRPLYIE